MGNVCFKPKNVGYQSLNSEYGSNDIEPKEEIEKKIEINDKVQYLEDNLKTDKDISQFLSFVINIMKGYALVNHNHSNRKIRKKVVNDYKNIDSINKSLKLLEKSDKYVVSQNNELKAKQELFKCLKHDHPKKQEFGEKLKNEENNLQKLKIEYAFAKEKSMIKIKKNICRMLPTLVEFYKVDYKFKSKKNKISI